MSKYKFEQRRVHYSKNPELIASLGCYQIMIHNEEEVDYYPRWYHIELRWCGDTIAEYTGDGVHEPMACGYSSFKKSDRKHKRAVRLLKKIGYPIIWGSY